MKAATAVGKIKPLVEGLSDRNVSRNALLAIEEAKKGIYLRIPPCVCVCAYSCVCVCV